MSVSGVGCQGPYRCQVSRKKNKKAEKLQTRLRKDALILALVCNQLLARIIHASVSRDREDGCATWQPQGFESEAY